MNGLPNKRLVSNSKAIHTRSVFAVVVCIISLTVLTYAPSCLAGNCSPADGYGVRDCFAAITPGRWLRSLHNSK